MYDFQNYTTMREKIGELYQSGKHAEATNILEWGLTEFPDHLFANVFNLAFFQVQLSELEKAIQTLQYGLERGIWFGPFELGAEIWNPLRELDSFKEILARCEECQRQAQNKAKPELTIVTPDEYEPSKKYPLFIALHGGGETVAEFLPQWTSPTLKSNFIVAYPQSSRVISMRGFSWMGNDQDRKEIAEAYQTISKDYAIDTDLILMGGFSAGGHLTLTLLLDEEETLPLRGFIVLCPPVPEGYSFKDITRIKKRGQRGLILTTEMDGRVEEQRKIAEALDEGGVPVQFAITPNIGHWYPVDLGEQIDQAINFILGKKG